MNNKKIMSEIKKINRKKNKTLKTLSVVIAGLILFSIVAWVVLFSIGTVYYNMDNLFYLKIDDFSNALMDKLQLAMLLVSTVAFGKVFVFEAQKDTLKKIIGKRNKKAVR